MVSAYYFRRPFTRKKGMRSRVVITVIASLSHQTGKALFFKRINWND
jgi:hypothetical protein